MAESAASRHWLHSMHDIEPPDELIERLRHKDNADDYPDDVDDELLARLHSENSTLPTRIANPDTELAAMREQLEAHGDTIIGLQALVAEMQSSLEAVHELVLKIAIRMDIQ